MDHDIHLYGCAADSHADIYTDKYGNSHANRYRHIYGHIHPERYRFRDPFGHLHTNTYRNAHKDHDLDRHSNAHVNRLTGLQPDRKCYSLRVTYRYYFQYSNTDMDRHAAHIHGYAYNNAN
jgi:hypothetical protein